MSNLSHRQQKIQEKRKQTPWRDFLLEFASWFSFNLYKYDSMIQRFPSTSRKPKVILNKEIPNINQPVHEVDKSKTFFSQLEDLYKDSFLGNVFFYGENPGCDYSDSVYGAKNSYLCFSLGYGAENILYSSFVWTNVSFILNSFYVEEGSQIVANSVNIHSSMKVFYSKYITGSNNIRFSTNLIGCSECLFCNDIQNVQYYIHNVGYSKEEYGVKKQEILTEKSKFSLRYSSLPQGINYLSNNVTGSGIIKCDNVENGYYCRDFSNGRNVFIASGGIQGSMDYKDCFDVGLNSNHFCGVVGGGLNSNHIYFSTGINQSQNMYYSIFCDSCSFCLGCIGLKNKSYCIFNKQYSKEEWYEKVDEIFGQMDRDGTLGQFFPSSMNPFYFNDTAAYLIDTSFTKEEVTAKSYLRRDEPIKVDIPDNTIIVKTSDLDQYEGFDENNNRTINPEILKIIIQDEQGNIYKIVKMEYDFLMKHGLPLPRKHRLDRMKENFKIN